jgi:hypothetical protein
MSIVTPAMIKLILPETELADTNIQAFITTAERFLEASSVSASVDINTVEELTKWLTAHYITATVERLAISEKAGPTEQKFANVYSKNLSSTPYGQTAITLDYSGILNQLSQGKRNIVFFAIPEGEIA